MYNVFNLSLKPLLLYISIQQASGFFSNISRKPMANLSLSPSQCQLWLLFWNYVIMNMLFAFICRLAHQVLQLQTESSSSPCTATWKWYSFFILELTFLITSNILMSFILLPFLFLLQCEEMDLYPHFICSQIVSDWWNWKYVNVLLFFLLLLFNSWIMIRCR